MVECEGDGQQGEWRGEAASGDVRVHEEQRGARDGECPEGREEAEGGELCGVVGEGALKDFECGEESEPEAEEVGEEQDPGEGEVSVVDEEGEGGGEDGKAEVLGDEDRVVGKEGGVEGVLDAGDVEAAVLGEWVIALDE